MSSTESLQHRASRTAFVGRDRELAELRAGLDDAIAGRGRLFLVAGEPGIGKTRLVDELSVEARACGVRIIWGRCWEGGGAPAYWPWIQVVRACIPLMSPGQAVALLGEEGAQIIPELGEQSQERGRPSSPVLDVEAQRFRLFDSVANLLKGLAALKPVLIIFDDLHEADQASLRMLRFVSRELKGARVLIAGTHRDVEVRRSLELSSLIGELVREGHEVPLAGLGETELAQLAENISGQELDEEFVSNLYRVTEGNPLFVDGILRVLVAEDRLKDLGRLESAPFVIPQGVRQAITRWLALLSSDARSIVDVAAAIGNEFDLIAVLRVGESPSGRALDLMREASNAGIVKPIHNGHYRFAHALIRGVINGEQPPATLARLHRRIGEVLEDLYRSDPRPHLAELAYHFCEAADCGTAEKAIDYSIRAGDAALAAFAYEEAWANSRLALKLADQHQVARPRRAEILERLTDLALVGIGGENVSYAEEWVRISEGLGDVEQVADAYARLASHLCGPGRYEAERVHELCRMVEGLLRGRPERIALSEVYGAEAYVFINAARYVEALRFASRALEIAERLGDESRQAFSAAAVGLALHQLGRLSEGHRYIDRAWKQGDAHDYAEACQAATIAGAFTSLLEADPNESIRWYFRELAKPRTRRARNWNKAEMLGQMCSAMIIAGELERAREVREQNPRLMPIWSFLLAEGKFSETERLQVQWIDDVRRRGLGAWLGSSGHEHAELLHARGDDVGAEAILLEVLEVATSGSGVLVELVMRSRLAGLYAELSRLEEAERHLARCRVILTSGEDWRGLVGLVAQSEALLASTRRDFERAHTEFGRAAEIFHRYRAVWKEAETLRSWGRAMMAAGNHNAAIEKFDAAIEIYTRIGAGQPWIDRVMAEKNRPTDSAPTPAEVEKPRGDDDCVLRREGEFWTLEHGDQVFRLRHSKGLSYLAQLLSNPGREFSAMEMAQTVDAGLSQDDGAEPDEDDEVAASEHQSHAGLEMRGDLGDAGEMLDASAKVAYKRRRDELLDEIDEAREFHDEERAARAQVEIDALARELKRAVGLAGRDRRAASASVRSRLSVTRAVRSAIERIAKNNPDLGKALSATIKTGSFCCFTPDPRAPITWRF